MGGRVEGPDPDRLRSEAVLKIGTSPASSLEEAHNHLEPRLETKVQSLTLGLHVSWQLELTGKDGLSGE